MHTSQLNWNEIELKSQKIMDALSLYLLPVISCLFFSNLYINCSLILHHLNFWKTDCELYYVKINHNVTLTLIYNNRAVGKSCLVVHDNKLHYFSFLWKYMLFFLSLNWDPVTMCMQYIAQRTTTQNIWFHQSVLRCTVLWFWFFMSCVTEIMPWEKCPCQ